MADPPTDVPAASKRSWRFTGTLFGGLAVFTTGVLVGYWVGGRKGYRIGRQHGRAEIRAIDRPASSHHARAASPGPRTPPVAASPVAPGDWSLEMKGRLHQAEDFIHKIRDRQDEIMKLWHQKAWWTQELMSGVASRHADTIDLVKDRLSEVHHNIAHALVEAKQMSEDQIEPFKRVLNQPVDTHMEWLRGQCRGRLDQHLELLNNQARTVALAMEQVNPAQWMHTDLQPLLAKYETAVAKVGHAIQQRDPGQRIQAIGELHIATKCLSDKISVGS